MRCQIECQIAFISLMENKWPSNAHHIRTCRIIVTLLDARDNRFKRNHVIKIAFFAPLLHATCRTFYFLFMIMITIICDYFLFVCLLCQCNWHSMLLVSCLLLYAYIPQLQVHRHSHSFNNYQSKRLFQTIQWEKYWIMRG